MSSGYPGVSEDLMKAADLNYSVEEKKFIDILANQVRGQSIQWGLATSTLYSTKLLDRALTKHSDALTRAAEASDHYARNLVGATWALFAATTVLAVATIVLLCW